ncbi:MAG TPA: carbon monoxide dehydrogenase subunit G [Ramlibacter sp.]|jgi:carbon monoxide dehydrogenase subunit G|uniref:CoxG family protein n=1 Tax=Ramlibacter sp. TaxID=1917967 RepID=UPI002D3E5BC6|nr:carbon monoxide dehydrogenase subunit G [Ramlibacter sp.]HZY20459.1 carbon monoxide dehydrogenase subunit G [Ramlibacter sp.]
MDMQGSRELAATREQAWEALNDPQVLKACIPGCDKVEPTGENQYAVGMSVKVGPVSAKFAGRILLQDVQPPSSYTLKFEGQGGAAGFGKGQAQVRLAPRAAGCELSYTVNAQVGGRIAQVGQRLIDGVARSMAEDFFKRFEAQLQQRHPPAVDGTPGSAGSTGSTGSTGGTTAARMAATSAGAAQPAGTGTPVEGVNGGAAVSSGSVVPLWVWAAAAVLVAVLAYSVLQ